MKDTKAEPPPPISSEGDAIKVFLRVRPPENVSSALPFTGRVVEVNTNNNSVTLLAKPESKTFTFDHVADVNSTQDSVFSTVGKTLIESCVAGYNGTIFAYGQTGSGKTFTMLGQSEECDNFQHELRGVIPRSFEHLFNVIARESELHGDRKQFLCKCTFLEIYQEQVYDLLDPAAANLQLRENIKKGVFVDGLMEQVVATPAEAYQALSSGWLNRRVAATSMNRESSRSHAVFTLCIESKEEKNGVKNVRESVLNLVDLAGSERQKDTNTVGIRLKEAGKINQSLSVLGNVIMSLVKIAQGRTQHIPYRDSKLTFLLRDSLGGNARTSIVACVHPDAKCFGETLSTLNFAKRAKLIKNKAVVNEDTQGNVAHLQTEIRRLRDMLTHFQSGNIPPSIPLESAGGEGGTTGNLVPHGTDVEWRRKFLEAMLFREKSEQEKEILRQRLSSYDEEMKKKERMVQSSRLIIKFRESTIAKLEKSLKNAGLEPTEDATIVKIEEDVKALKAMLEQYPKVAQLDQQLHSLQAQLADARIRLSNTTAALLDSNRLYELEKSFRELQVANRRESLIRSPHSIDSISSTSIQKLREQKEALDKENQQLKKQAVDEQQSWQSKEASLQAELTTTRKMISDLERLLEANSLKQRIQHDALTNLHCQTIRALTPQRDTYDLRNRTVVCNPVEPNQDNSIEMEDICQEAPPAAMMDNAHEILTDEIKALQQTNSSLQERLEEYETDMLRLHQQISQTELERQSLNEMLNKERKDNAENLEKQEKSLQELKATVDTLTADLRYAKEEAQDYQLLLQSSDKELKSVKEKSSAHSSSTEQKVNFLETQLLQVQCIVETLGKQLEDEVKEREVMEEKLEMQLTEKMFLEQQTQTLEKALCEINQKFLASSNKIEEMECSLAAEKEQQQQLQERSQQFEKEQEESHLKTLSAVTEELEAAKRTLSENKEENQAHLKVVADLTTELETAKRSVSDSQAALQQQVQRVQELRASLQEVEDRCSLLQDLANSRAVEAADASNQCEALQSQLNSKTTDVASLKVQTDLLTDDLTFYQEQNEKNVQECDVLRHNLESLEKEKDELSNEIMSLKSEVSERDSRLQLITQHLEEVKLQQASTPAASPEKHTEQASVHENKLATMVEELTQAREQWTEENQLLKRELSSLKLEVTETAALTKKCEDLQCQLDNQAVVFKESMSQLQEDNAMERSEVHMLKESLMEAQRQQEAIIKDKENLLSEFEEAQAERQRLDNEVNRLKAVVEKSYVEKDELISQTEELKEENKITKQELVEAAQRSQELADFNAVLAGHANHQQKVCYVQRLQTDFNAMKEKCEELARQNCALRARGFASPLCDRTNSQMSETETELKRNMPV